MAEEHSFCCSIRPDRANNTVEGRTFLCKKCRNIFKLPLSDSSQPDRASTCPKCGSAEIEEAPCWAPLGSGTNVFESSDWEYECQQCHQTFKMPIPKSPTEEKSRRCPSCGTGNIQRLNVTGGQPLYCG